MEINLQLDDACDPDMVDALVKGARLGMRAATVEDITSPSELVTAAFTLLDHVLRGMRQAQAPEERFHNAKEIHRVLSEMLADHGRVPS